MWAESTGKPAFADTGGPAHDHIVVGIDPLAVGELVEQRTIETVRSAVIDVLDDGVMAQPGIARPGGQALVATKGNLAVDEQAEPVGMGERVAPSPEVSSSAKAWAIPDSPSWVS